MSDDTIVNQPSAEFISIEVQFNSVEMDLARRWAVGEVPAMFVKRPAADLRKMVKAWWQIYHESIAAANERTRTIWERNPAYPADVFDTPALISALQQIENRLDMKALLHFRDLHQGEHSAIGILRITINYYSSLLKTSK